MKYFPALLVVGVAALLLGSLYYFQRTDTPAFTEGSEQLDADGASKAAAISGNQLTAPVVEKTQDVAAKTANDEILLRPDENPNYPTFKDRISEVQARRNGQLVVDAAQLWDASQQPNAWKPLDAPPDSLNLTDEEKNDGRKFIELSPLKLESLVAGDVLEVDMGDAGKTLKIKIDGARSEDDGKNVTWTGDSIDTDSPYHLTITKGDTLVVGGLSTPEGLYQIEVHDGKGWIVSSATLFRKGTDQHITVPQELLDNPPKDAVILPIDPAGKKH